MTDLEMDLLIANARIKALEAQLAAERAKYAELQRYNVDCTKACDRQMVEILELREQNAQLPEIQRRELAAVEDLETIVESGSECNVCKHRVGVSGCPIRYTGCVFIWRGPQGAKKQPVFYNCPTCGCVVSDMISACPKCGRELRGPQEAGKGETHE